MTARLRGLQRSENPGMSNDKWGEKPHHRKSKVSSATVIGGGLGGPKANDVDGQQVNIPAQRCDYPLMTHFKVLQLLWL